MFALRISKRETKFGMAQSKWSPRVAFNYSDVESETTREMVGARLGGPMHSKIFRVWIG
jgi:hypothetical protein